VEHLGLIVQLAADFIEETGRDILRGRLDSVKRFDFVEITSL